MINTACGPAVEEDGRSFKLMCNCPDGGKEIIYKIAGEQAQRPGEPFFTCGSVRAPFCGFVALISPAWNFGTPLRNGV